jgi:CheY-like chemotaxis protein
VLVVEDESAIRDVTRLTLEGAGYRVLTAEDGASALAVFAEHRHDIQLVLTDIVMPIMDGPATIRALEKMDPDIRIIAASGHNNVQKSVHAHPNVHRVLAKPFTADALLSAVQEVLARK